MPYVIRRDNPEGSKYKFSYYSPTGWHQLANRFDCTVKVPVFPSKKAVVEWCAEQELRHSWLNLELAGWELVQVRNRKIEGLMVHAINYNNKVRAISGTSAMMAQAYRSMGYVPYAEDVERKCKMIKAELARCYAITKAELEMENFHAKSRQ